MNKLIERFNQDSTVKNAKAVISYSQKHPITACIYGDDIKRVNNWLKTWGVICSKI